LYFRPTMAEQDKIRKELWVAWTHSAISRYTAPDSIDDSHELVDDMADVASDYADAMLEEYEKRFSGGKGRSRRKKPQDDDEDDDD
jgi:hypothetical protein